MRELKLNVPEILGLISKHDIDDTFFRLKLHLPAGEISPRETFVNVKISPFEYEKILSFDELSRARFVTDQAFLQTHNFSRSSNKFRFRTVAAEKDKPRRFRMSFRVGDKEQDRKCCIARGRLSEATARELRSLQNQPDPRKEHHHEIGAAMKFLQIQQGNSSTPSLYEINLDSSSILKGNHDGCEVPKARASCHTHPSGEYPRQKVNFAWASKDDILAIREKSLDETENSIIHIVCSSEGFYVISINEDMLKAGGNLIDKIEKANIGRYYQVRLPNISQTNNDNLPETPEEYIKYVSSIPKKHRIYDVCFVKWPESGHSTEFRFAYPSCSGKCNPSKCEECSDLG